jgi:hypothetical protein
MLIVLCAILLQVFHLYISAPIKPGHVISPGIWLVKCGILPFLPTCHNQYLTFAPDGMVSLKDARNNTLWEMQGGVCGKNDKTCIAGLHVLDDHSIVIGGKPISAVTVYGDAELAPWPFAEQPNVRIVHKPAVAAPVPAAVVVE